MKTRSPSDPEPNGRPSIRDGLVGGLLGGVAVILLFLALDLAQGQVFRTPAFLSSAVFGPIPESVEVARIALFTLVHLAVFAVVGGAAVWLFRLAMVPANVLLGGIFGFFVLTFLFYGALSLAEVPVVEAPEWPAVLLGNFLAGVVLGGYLHWVGPLPGIVGAANLLKQHPILREGVMVGVIGAVVLAVWFFVMDLVLREAFFTPAALGSMLFLGAGSPDAVVISTGTVLGYTAVHGAAFLIIGVVAAGVVAGVEKYPALQYAVVMLFAIFAVAFIALVTVLGIWILNELAVWSVLMGNLLAALAMGGYLWRVHPLLGDVLREEVRAAGVWRED